MSSDQTSGSWYLHSQGRRFGPLSEDEIRGYFHAGMVKAGDLITMPGQAEMKTAAEAAEILGEAPPVAAPGAHVHVPTPSRPIAPTGVGAGPNAVPGQGLPVLPSPTLFIEKKDSLSWVVPVACIGVLALVLYLGLAMLRKFQASIDPQSPLSKSLAVPQVEQAPADNPSANPTSAPPSPTVPAGFGDASVSNEWLVKADRLSREADWSGLQAHSRQWSLAEPGRDMPWIYLGVAHANLQQNGLAIDALNEVLKTQPKHPVARSALADVYLQSGQFQLAADILRELAPADSGNARLWNNLGNAYFGIGNYDESVKALETAVGLAPDNQRAWGNLAKAYESGGYPEKAAAARMKAGPAQ